MRPGLTLFIDADDTLWENNIYFDSVIDRTATRLTEYGVSTERTREALLAIERQRTRAHGYGSLNFGASLEVLCEHVGIGESLDQLRPFLRAEIAALRRKRLELLPDVPDTLAYLRRRHRVVLFTKGNHDEQWDKVVRFGAARPVPSGRCRAREGPGRLRRRRAAAGRHGPNTPG